MEESDRLILDVMSLMFWRDGDCSLFSKTDHRFCTLHILMSFIPMLELGTC
jgi:hypothetical protein